MADAQALQAQYGRLSPALFRRIQAAAPTDRFPVMIWLAPPAGQTMPELQAAAKATLVAQSPDAQEAQRRTGDPLLARNPAAAKQLQSKYVQLLASSTKPVTDVLVNELRARGYSATAEAVQLVVQTDIPRSVIEELAGRQSIGRIDVRPTGIVSYSTNSSVQSTQRVPGRTPRPAA